MNEVTNIHLGRQAFTISVDAHRQLRHYLDAIKKQGVDADVMNEVELRMAELLHERGVTSHKVVLPADIAFLKERLGSPTDFSDDDAGAQGEELRQAADKKLFRDTDTAMVAGVASGLAAYTGLDVLLVRVLFVIAAIATAGWGVLLYIALWLLVPEAKTSSDRLRMAGKPVTIDGLKEAVERADVKGAAARAHATLAGPVNTVFRFVLKVVGLGFILSGLSMLLGLIAGGTYLVLHSGSWLHDNFFPVGLRQHVLLDIAGAVTGLVALFIIIFGIAIFRRKWPIRTWVTGVLVGLAFIGLAVGGALAADVYPTVRNQYNANIHTSMRTTKPFTSVDFTGSGVNIQYEPSSTYFITARYYGQPNVGNIKTTVQNGTLHIDASQFKWRRSCTAICLPDTYQMTVTVHSPNALQLLVPDVPMPPEPTDAPRP